MLKRVDSTRLRTGMYLHKLGGSWLKHPFWITSFLLTTQDEIARIHYSGIREVWIDTERGLDVEHSAVEQARAAVPQQPATPAPAAEMKPDPAKPLLLADEAPRIRAQPATPAPAAEMEPDPVKPASLADEAASAARICEQAKRFIDDMFHEARMGRAVAARDALPLVEEITASVARNQHALISIARLKTTDNYTYMHSVAVCGLMIALSRQMGLDEKTTREAGLAGLLHDVGKAGVPAGILNKPGKLTVDEFTLIKAHPSHGFHMLQRSPGITETALDVCLHHHEKMDGTGYPHQLNAESISQAARMGAVCDVYDAITSDRPYKEGWSPYTALRKMAEWSNGHFDNQIFQAFVRTIGIYPVGVLVRLRSERLGVVVGQAADSLLLPQVKVFYCTRRKKLLRESIVDLAREPDDSIISNEDPVAWGLPDLTTLWQTPVSGG